MTERRRGGLGRGLGALIPTAPTQQAEPGDTPVDVFFPRRTTTNPYTGEVPSRHRYNQQKSSDTTNTGSPARTLDSSVDASADGNLAMSERPDLVPVVGARFAELDLDSITPNAKQPRIVFDDDELNELVNSITEVGLLQPIVVRPAGPGTFELVMGERRWRACRIAGLTKVPAIVRDTADDAMLRDALLENLHRSQLNPLEEAAAYQQLLDDFGGTHEELAARIGRSRPQISNTLRLLKLPALVQRRVAAGVLSAGHARALLALPDGAGQERLAQRIVAEGLSVRSVEEIVAMGGDAERPSREPRGARSQLPQLTELANRLSDRFDTTVKVDLGQRKGKVTIEFASLEDLQRIVSSIAPGTTLHE